MRQPCLSGADIPRALRANDMHLPNRASGLLPLLRRLSSETTLIGAVLAERDPAADPTYVAPPVANRCAREILTGIAMRRCGTADPHYLHPEATDHGQG